MTIRVLLAIDEPMFEDSLEDLPIIKQDVLDNLGHDVTFQEMDPRWLDTHKMPTGFDLCIVDFGGAASFPGSNCGEDYANKLARAIDNHPGKLFMVWSSFTVRWYRTIVLDLLEVSLGREVDDDEFKCPANVMLYPADRNWDFDKEQIDIEAAWQRARVWFGLPPIVKTGEDDV